MGDFISREALRRDLIDNWSFYSVLLKNALERQPAVDAVEVVRCKDCALYRPDQMPDGELQCDMTGAYMKPDDFCSYGERREENG